MPGDRGVTDAADSEAVLRIFFLRASEDFDVSAPLLPLLEEGLRAGASVGRISLAISRTRTAWSSLLRLETRSYMPKRSTSMMRFGCTSQTVRRIRKRLRRTSGLLWSNFSMIRLKNWDLAIPMAIG